MKKKFVNWVISIVKKEKKYSKDELDVMIYALEGIYLTFTKIIVITILAFVLGIGKEYGLFFLFYFPIRCLSFGWHANTTLQCWIVSTIAFLGIPYLFSVITINIWIKIILLLFSLIIFCLFAPADSKKRPIVAKKRRLFFKFSSLMFVVLYGLFIIKYNTLITNLMLAGILYQCLLINPLIYKISGQSFNNYKAYNLN